MKTGYRIVGLVAVLISLLACAFCITVFQNEATASGWNYWILELLLSALLLIAVVFGRLLFRPDLERATQFLWATVIVLIAALFISSGIKKDFRGLEGNSLSLLAGIPVLLAGISASLMAKKEESVFYHEFQSKINC